LSAQGVEPMSDHALEQLITKPTELARQTIYIQWNTHKNVGAVETRRDLSTFIGLCVYKCPAAPPDPPFLGLLVFCSVELSHMPNDSTVLGIEV